MAYSGTLNGTGANNRVSLTFTPTAGNLTLTVSGSVTNWQLEAGSNATSLIKTVSGSVTRNADVISKSGVSSLIGQTEGSILIKGYQLNRGVIFRLRNNASTSLNIILVFCVDTNGRVEIGVTKNNVNISNNSPISPNNIKNKNIVIIYSDNIFKFFINGVLFYSYTYPSPTNFSSILDTLEFGSLTENGTATFNSIAIWKTQLTDAQAIKLTTL